MLTPAPCDMDYLRLRAVECGDCLEWQGASTRGRMPVVSINRKQHYVRHLVYWITHGHPPPKSYRMVISTTCRNDACIEPKHVVRISASERNKRAAAAGAFRSTAYRAAVAAGKRAHSKLSDEAVAAIRASDEPLRVLAKRHGISEHYAGAIRRGQFRIDYRSPFAGLLQGGA